MRENEAIFQTSAHVDSRADVTHGWWKNRIWHEQINVLLFEIKRPAGRRCNLFITLLIVASVMVSMLGTVKGLGVLSYQRFHVFEIAVTWIFALEYILRVYAARRPLDYIFSFYGIVDLLTVLPLLIFGDPNLTIKLLRLMRLIKLVRYLRALRLFIASMRDAFEILFVTLGAILLGAAVAGNMVYILEPETFPNAFAGAWWSIVTMSTVGYGDMVPHSIGGRIIAMLLIVLGISLFAAITGVVSVKVARTLHHGAECQSCGKSIAPDYPYCPYCATAQISNKESAPEV